MTAIKKLVVGIDIGGTNTKFGFVDKAGNSWGESSIPTDSFEEVDQYLQVLTNAIQIEREKLPFQIEIQGIGVGAPNANYFKGTIEDPPNLPWKGVVPFSQKLKEYYPVEVALTNDANAAALGEMLYGAAQGMKNFIVVTLGTGLGSGIVANGNLVYGHDGFAAEMGHLLVNINGRQCGCGRKGCLETYVSATGIRRTIYKLLADSNAQTSLRSVAFDKLTAPMISKAAAEGDVVALSAFDYTAKILGIKLADAVAMTSPEAIIVFGGLAQAGDLLLEPVKSYMEENLLNIYKNKVAILPSGLHGKNAAVMGAAALIWTELTSEKSAQGQLA